MHAYRGFIAFAAFLMVNSDAFVRADGEKKMDSGFIIRLELDPNAVSPDAENINGKVFITNESEKDVTIRCNSSPRQYIRLKVYGDKGNLAVDGQYWTIYSPSLEQYEWTIKKGTTEKLDIDVGLFFGSSKRFPGEYEVVAEYDAKGLPKLVSKAVGLVVKRK